MGWARGVQREFDSGNELIIGLRDASASGGGIRKGHKVKQLGRPIYSTLRHTFTNSRTVPAQKLPGDRLPLGRASPRYKGRPCVSSVATGTRGEEADAPIQIASASPTVSAGAWCDSKSIPIWSPPSQSSSL